MSDTAVLPSVAAEWKEAPQGDLAPRDAPVTLKDTQAKDLVFEPGHNHDARLGALQQAV